MTRVVNVPGRLHSVEQGNILAGANEIYDDTKLKKQNVINGETDAELLRLDQAKQDNLTFDNVPMENSTNPVTSGGVYASELTLSQAIEAILILIPAAASAVNKLADVAFVNSTVATASATFRGTYNLVSDLHLSVSASHQDIATALGTVVSTADNNDYTFVQVPVSDTSQEIRVTERYKFNGTSWAYEYDLNNSGFTADQWAAINSAITAALVQKLRALPTDAELSLLLAAKQAVLSWDTTPISGSTNPVTSGGLYEVINAITTVIPSAASVNNKLVDEARMTSFTEGFALKSEMSVTPGTGGNAGKTTIQLKPGTSATVLTDTLINVTYADLVTLRNGGNLVKGQFYRITDFVTTVNPSLTEVRSAGHAFDLIVQALDVDVLSEDAKAIQHAGDTYFQNSKLEAWQLKYSLDNDTTRFEWADSTNGKGVIWRMVDEFENDIPYDFKNVQYKRYITDNKYGLIVASSLLTDATYGNVMKRAMEVLAEIYGTGMNYENYHNYLTRGMNVNTYTTKGSELTGSYVGYDLETPAVIDSNDDYVMVWTARPSSYPIYIKTVGSLWCYTFHIKDAETGSVDGSTAYKIICNNVICTNGGRMVVQTLEEKHYLNNIVFCEYDANRTSFSSYNKFDYNCRALTLGRDSYSNSFEGVCQYSCFRTRQCDFKNTSVFMAINEVDSSTFYQQTYCLLAIKISQSRIKVQTMVAGTDFFDNIISHNCLRLTFGNNCFDNYFEECYNSSFDDNFKVNNCHAVNNSTISKYAVNNNLYMLSHVIIDKEYFENNIIENCSYVTITSNQTTGAAALLMNIKVTGVQAADEASRKTISHDTVNDTFETEYKPQNSQTVFV